MGSVDISDARKRLSKLVDQAASGVDVMLCRNGKPVARITRLELAARGIKFGVLKGRVAIGADFDAPLTKKVQAGFEGR